MRTTRLIIAAAVITLGCVPAHAKAWRGIVPLRSTRADVERLLGSPETGTRNRYKTGTKTLSVTYAETNCAYVTAGCRPVATRAPALTPDTTLVKTVDDMKITLELGGPLVGGSVVPLNYRLTDSVTGKPVQDLEPYLGAWGPTLILSADQSDYLHTHPSEMISNRIDRAVRVDRMWSLRQCFRLPATIASGLSFNARAESRLFLSR